MRAFVPAVTAALLTLGALAGDAHAQGGQDFPVTRIAQPPVLDGVLSDEAWLIDPLPLSTWVSYNPIRGDQMPAHFQTDVRVVHDDRNIYFAIHCHDNEPDKIRTTISKRDTVFSDDWVALSLDSAGTGQTAYHLFVNPSGIQMDAINTSASGEQFDVDVIWYSAGKVTSDGYIVEIRVPLQTLRFNGGADVRMGLLFFRHVSRMGKSFSWPEMPPGQWVFDTPGHVRFANLSQPRLVEVLPSVTSGVSQERSAGVWQEADSDTNVGASGKFGITSNITLDGTINPDFSQVESDAYQVEVNQRFPVFYSEKRPFFMEGMGLFNLAGTSGPGNMRTAVHTRKIIDPFWGTKVTGTAGKTTFGVLNSWDETPVALDPTSDDVQSPGKLWTIARATYALRRSDYVGAIVTDTEYGDRYNRVAGADMSLRFSAPQQLTATFLTTQTGDDREGTTQGNAAQASYSYNTRRVELAGQVEHYDRDFQMDSAFYNRTGFTSGWWIGGVNFYPQRQGKPFWLQQWTLRSFGRAGYDDVQRGSEAHVSGSVGFNFTRQGFFNVEFGRGHEPWLGHRFKNGGFNSFGRVQAFRWLQTFGGYNNGYQPFYDDVDPFQGRSSGTFFGIELQPNQRLNQSVEFNMVRFNRASTGERVYSVDIINSKTTFQFNRNFLIRFIGRYDSSAERILTDLLASYEFVPGTVVHAGYGSLYERGTLQTFAPTNEKAKYEAVNRGLFFKASYLRRF
jgi:hypothetical protein